MSNVITARIDDETLALVDRVASAQGRSRAWFVAKAIRSAAEKEADFLAFIQQGVDSANRGDLISQEEMERWWAERKANRRMSIAAE